MNLSWIGRVAVVLVLALSMDVSARSLRRDIKRQRFQLLNITAETGGDYGVAYGLNKAGQVVGAANTAPTSNYNAFIYHPATGLRFLPTLPGARNTQAEDINKAGQIVGTASISNTTHGLIWSADGEVMELDPGTNWLEVVPYSINDDGIVTGTVYAPIKGHAGFVWDAANGFRFLPSFTGVRTINSAGTVLYTGTAYADSLDSAVQTFEVPGLYGESHDLSNSGLIVGDYTVSTSGYTQGFIFKPGRPVETLPRLSGANSSSAWRINSHRQSVGRSDSRAVLWERQRIHDLNELIPANSGWNLLVDAKGINDKGEIVGYGTATNGFTAFLLIPGKP